MKEGKKTTAKRKVSSSASSKRVVPKNQTPKMPAHREEPPKVKKIDVEEINKDFDDVENEDRRLIVFIAIAILVIVGTVIGLLVGCEKKQNVEPEPEKPGTDVIVPEKPDEKGNEEDEGVVTREIVRKVRAVYRTHKTKKSTTGKKDKKDETEEETVTYDVTFYLGEETNVEEVEEGKTPSEYVPDGYSVCRYYKDSALEEEYDMTEKITSSVNIYMDCDAITYTIVYDPETSNPTEYEVTDGDVALADPTVPENQYFNGWYTEPEFTNKVTALNKSLIKHADENNVIHLYAYFSDEPVEEPPVEPTDDGTTGETLDGETIENEPRLEPAEEIIDDEVVEPTEEETDTPDVTEPTEPVVEDDVVEPSEPTEEVVPVEPTEPEVTDDEEEVTVTEPVVTDEPEVTEPTMTEPTVEQPTVEPTTEPKEETTPVVEETHQEEKVETVTPKEEVVVQKEETVTKEEVVEKKEEVVVQEPKEEVKEEVKVEEKKEVKQEVKQTPKVEKAEPKPEPKPEVEEKVPEVVETPVSETEETTE